MSLEEFRAIEALPEISAAVASIGSSGTFTYRDRELKGVGYDAYSPDWIKTDRADIDPGRSFTESEHDGAAPVVVVNDSLKSQLFSDSDPIGKEIQIDGRAFTVIGVFHTKAGFLKILNGRGPDNPRAVVPLTTTDT